jgi:hypothetical protein
MMIAGAFGVPLGGRGHEGSVVTAAEGLEIKWFPLFLLVPHFGLPQNIEREAVRERSREEEEGRREGARSKEGRWRLTKEAGENAS